MVLGYYEEETKRLLKEVAEGKRSKVFKAEDGNVFTTQEEAEWYNLFNLNHNGRSFKLEIPDNTIMDFKTKEDMYFFLNDNYGHTNMGLIDCIVSYPTTAVLLEGCSFGDNTVEVITLDEFKLRLIAQIQSVV